MASIIKKINHNALLIEEGGIEKVVMGRGIGFGAVRHRSFDMELADKVYVLDLEEESERFRRMKGSRAHVLKQYI